MDAIEDSLNVHHFRVRPHQTDMYAAMYHGAYLDIFDDARIETFRRLGYTYERMLAGGWMAVIRRIVADFLAPSRMDELLAVQVTIPRLRRATIEIHYEALNGDVVVATETATFAFVNREGRPIGVPPDLRQVILDHASELGATLG